MGNCLHDATAATMYLSLNQPMTPFLTAEPQICAKVSKTQGTIHVSACNFWVKWNRS